MRHLPLVMCMFISGVALAASDLAGSADHPLITRYPGAYIAAYGVQNFDKYAIPTGKVTGYKNIDDWLPVVDGKVTRIFYRIPESDRGIVEVHQNFVNALKRGGFDIQAEGVTNTSKPSGEIGARTFLGVVYEKNAQSVKGEVNLLQGSSTSGGSGYVAGKLARASGDVYAAIATTQYSEREVTAMVDIIEIAPLEDGLVFVDAAAMAQGITAEGKIALYGIYFDFDKATLKPESKPTLDEIAKLMKDNPALSVYIVGHTDMKGALDYNLKLSKDRAAAVVNALVSDYMIAKERLAAQGVGPLAPVASNKGEAGMAKNRRVELVEK